MGFKQDEMAALPGRGRKKNCNCPIKGKEVRGIGCLACSSVMDVGNACQGVTRGAW